jgi:hypothetical protein
MEIEQQIIIKCLVKEGLDAQAILTKMQLILTKAILRFEPSDSEWAEDIENAKTSRMTIARECYPLTISTPRFCVSFKNSSLSRRSKLPRRSRLRIAQCCTTCTKALDFDYFICFGLQI